MSRRILVADDEKGIRQALGQLLEYEGYEVRTVSSAVDAISEYEKWRPHLAFLDVEVEATVTGAASTRVAASMFILSTATPVKANKLFPSAVTCSLFACTPSTPGKVSREPFATVFHACIPSPCELYSISPEGCIASAAISPAAGTQTVCRQSRILPAVAS